MANLAAFVAGALGGRGASPADFIPRFHDDEGKGEPTQEEREAARVTAQRALAAALNAMAKKTNG